MLDKYKKDEFMMSARHMWGHHLRGQLQLFLEKEVQSHVSLALRGIFADTATLKNTCREANTNLKNIGREKGEGDAEERIRLFRKHLVDPKAEQDEGKLTQHKILDLWLEYVKTSQEGLETREADIKELGKFIPRVTAETQNDAQNIVNAMQALYDAKKESGKFRDFPFFWDSMLDLKKELRKKTTALDKPVRGAKMASGNHNSNKKEKRKHRTTGTSKG